MKIKLNKINTIGTHIFNPHSICFFAITNRCNARCNFCSIWKSKKKTSVNINYAKKALDKLYELNIRYLQITGGEPLTHPNLIEIAEYAANKGIITTIVTNGSLLTEENIKAMKIAGVDGIGISFDHYLPEVIEKNRGIPRLYEKIEESVKIANKMKLPVSALVTISKNNFNCIDKIAENINQIGFRYINFCYPMKDTKSTFKIGGNHENIVDFDDDELIEVIDKIIDLKKKGYNILNPTASLNDMKKYLMKKNVAYPCLGGYKVFYLDWNLELFKCMYKNEVYGSIFKINKTMIRKKSHCNECMLQCFRDPSIYYYGTKSIKSFLELAKNQLNWQ